MGGADQLSDMPHPIGASAATFCRYFSCADERELSAIIATSWIFSVLCTLQAGGTAGADKTATLGYSCGALPTAMNECIRHKVAGSKGRFRTRL